MQPEMLRASGGHGPETVMDKLGRAVVRAMPKLGVAQGPCLRLMKAWTRGHLEPTRLRSSQCSAGIGFNKNFQQPLATDMIPKIKVTSARGWNADAAALVAAMCRLAAVPFLDVANVAGNTRTIEPTVWDHVYVIAHNPGEKTPKQGYVFFAHRIPGGLDVEHNLVIDVDAVSGVRNLLQS